MRFLAGMVLFRSCKRPAKVELLKCRTVCDSARLLAMLLSTFHSSDAVLDGDTWCF